MVCTAKKEEDGLARRAIRWCVSQRVVEDQEHGVSIGKQDARFAFVPTRAHQTKGDDPDKQESAQGRTKPWGSSQENRVYPVPLHSTSVYIDTIIIVKQQRGLFDVAFEFLGFRRNGTTSLQETLMT